MARVLIVEDNRDIGLLYQRTFGLHETLMVDNAQAAIQLLHSQSFDLIILDMHLPGISGLSVLDHIDAGTIPVFAISADDTFKYQALQRGAIAWLTKPIEIDELLIKALPYLNGKISRSA
mgnify:CR=1 FL=1